MGLCLFSGPTWEEDALNDINETSILLNAQNMLNGRCGFIHNLNDNNELGIFNGRKKN